MAKNIARTNATIANGATKSDAIAMEQQRIPLAVITPATLTGTTFTFESATDATGTDYVPIYNGSSLYSVTVANNRYVALDPSVFEGVKRLKIVSGCAEGAARTIIVVSGEL